MSASLKAQLDRVRELITELETEYNKCLEQKNVSDKAKVITHEIIEKLANILDQIARKLWEKKLSLSLTDIEKKKATIYFPKSDDRHSFDSTIGRWLVKDFEKNFPECFNFLLSKQSFVNESNQWLTTLGKLASQKHIDLVPQKREEVTHIKISSNVGTVHLIVEHVKFGSGVSILGAPIDPITQRIVPTSGVEEKIEKWVSFVFEGYSLNALAFCQESYQKIQNLADEAESLHETF